MIGNGDVYNDQNERVIDGTKESDNSVANKISTTLTIGSVSQILQVMFKEFSVLAVSLTNFWTHLNLKAVLLLSLC